MGEASPCIHIVKGKKGKMTTPGNPMANIGTAIEGILDQIREAQDELQDGFFEVAGSINPSAVPKPVKQLRGHFGPVYSLHWAGPTKDVQLCSVSQDSKLIVWNAITQMKISAVSEANWAMTCAFEQTKSDKVAYGGLDNHCYIYDVSDSVGPKEPVQTLRDLHQGYLSCVRFTDAGSHMITASGDARCAYWDIESGTSKKIFAGHKQDVMSIAVDPNNPQVFVSASVDKTCKLWDARADSRKSKFTFFGHESDVNAIAFFPDGQAFASGSDDAKCLLFDIRSFQALNAYESDNVVTTVTSVAFSHSGRILFSSYDGETAPIAWDTINPLQGSNMIKRLSQKAHSRKVDCIGVSAHGHALASASWDHTIRIWA